MTLRLTVTMSDHTVTDFVSNVEGADAIGILQPSDNLCKVQGLPVVTLDGSHCGSYPILPFEKHHILIPVGRKCSSLLLKPGDGIPIPTKGNPQLENAEARQTAFF